MKLIDKLLRRWRTRVALKALPQEVNSVFDIGCEDGYLLKHIDNGTRQLDGCDPRLKGEFSAPRYRTFRGFFPEVLKAHQHRGPYDAIFAIAVFEHFTEKDLAESAIAIAGMLSDNGRLIISVPHPFVDGILDILMFFRLIDGQALEEHHAFDPNSLIPILSEHLRLASRKRFQLGLNNLFVFEKK